MKKFLVYLLVIVVAVALGFSVFYLIRDNEVVSISATSMYVKKGDEFKIELNWENKKAFSNADVLSSNTDIVDYNSSTGEFEAKSGGMARITFRTTNEKYRNLSCTVMVGDGSFENPFYIETPQQLMSIGNVVYASGTTQRINEDFTLDKFYRLVANIDMGAAMNGTDFWLPIGYNNGSGLTGQIEGNGHTISNIHINIPQYETDVEGRSVPESQKRIAFANGEINIGFVSKIGINGKVSGIIFDNVNITNYAINAETGDVTSNQKAYHNVGTIAGVSYGTIERCSVINSHINVNATQTTGGLVGKMLTTEIAAEEVDAAVNYQRVTARIDRSSASVKMGYAKDDRLEADQGVSGLVGGLAGQNVGNIIVYSYSMSDVKLTKDFVYMGGIVGELTYHDFVNKYGPGNIYMYAQNAGRIKDCYAVNNVDISLIEDAIVKGQKKSFVGGIVGHNLTTEEVVDGDAYFAEDDELVDATKEVLVNRIIGNYYRKSVEQGNLVAIANGIAVSHNYKNANNNRISNDDVKFEVEGKTEVDLKKEITYESHQTFDYEYNEDDGISNKIYTTVFWKFNSVWGLGAINDGFPYLNPDPFLEVSDDIYTVTNGISIHYADELIGVRLDGRYVIVRDIDMSLKLWAPLGTAKQPFTGSLVSAMNAKTKEFCKIINLRTQNNTDVDATYTLIDNAALIAFGSGAKGGQLKNIILENPSILNGRNSAGFVANNGYTYERADAVNEKTVTEIQKGLTIFNCEVRWGNIKGRSNVGGITAINYGDVTGCKVTAGAFDANNTTNILLVAGVDNATIGGITGKNLHLGTINKSSVRPRVTISAVGDGDQNVFIGGIAGRNEASITNATVAAREIGMGGSLAGSIGGIAGINYKDIRNSRVTTTGITAPTAVGQAVYAGGIAGTFLNEGNVKQSVVVDTNISGTYAGGIAGNMLFNGTYTINAQADDWYWGGFLTTKANIGGIQVDGITIEQCGVESSVTVQGHRAGGFAGDMENGYVRNSYTAAFLSGVNGSSIKAGFSPVMHFSGTSNSDKATGGFVDRSYSVCNFASQNGANWGYTSSEIFKNPIGGGLNLRSAGIVFKSYFASNVEGSPKKSETGNWIKDVVGFFSNLFGTSGDPNPTYNTSDFYGDKLKASFGDSGEIWNYQAENLPTLKVVNELAADINDNKIWWRKDANVSPVGDSADLKRQEDAENYYVMIKNEGVFTFSINADIKYDLEKLVVKVGGQRVYMKPDGTFATEVVLEDMQITVENYVIKEFDNVALDTGLDEIVTINQTLVKAEGNEKADKVQYGDKIQLDIVLADKYEADANGLIIEYETTNNTWVAVPKNEDGILELSATRNYTIRVQGYQIKTLKLIAAGTNSDGVNLELKDLVTEIQYGTENVKFKVNIKEGFTADSLVVKLGEAVLSADQDGYYTLVEAITENKTITMEGVLKLFTATLTEVQGVTISVSPAETEEDTFIIKEGTTIEIIITIEDGYVAGTDFDILVGETSVLAEVTDNGDKTYTLTITSVANNVVIEVTGVVEE